MTDPRRRASAGALAIALAAIAAGCAPRGPERIVLVVVDTLRRDFVSAYGGQRPTPHFDALAARGQVFPRVLASFHQTSMSMTALFTGRTPSLESGEPASPLPWNGTTWCGLARFADGDDDAACIPAGVATLAERLRDAGYWTIGVASNQFLFEPSGFSRGFDDWLEVGEAAPEQGPALRHRRPGPGPHASRTWRAVDGAAREAVARRRSDRFFLYVHYMDVHDYDQHGKTRRHYAEAVAREDAAFGRLVAHLEAEGLLDGAVVILTADHGERLGETHEPLPEGGPRRFGHFGNPSYQEVLEIPLIVAPPVVEDPAPLLRTQDVFGLILGIAGVEPADAAELEPDELFVGELNFRTYLEGRWKAAVRRETGRLHLFDLEADPGEKRDVASEHPEVASALSARIEAIADSLSAGGARREELTDEDERRLRALGYLE